MKILTFRRRYIRVLERVFQNALVCVLGASILFSDIAGLVLIVTPQVVDAAQVTIDATAGTTGPLHTHAGPQTVFVNDQVGYKFYVDSGGTSVYSKTTDGGSTWGVAVTVDTKTDIIGVAVWYDKWTPNDTGTKIHIAELDSASANDNIFYNALDTSNDTLLDPTATNTDPGNVQTYTLVSGANYPSITKATNGTMYVMVNDTTDSAVLRCSATCGTPTNWSETGTNPFTNANDYTMLLPLVGGDIMAITRVIGSEFIQSKKWNNTAATWDAAWVGIDNLATDNTTYDVGMAAVVASTTGTATTSIYLAYIADNATLGTDDDVRTARYINGLWATSTSATPTQNVLTNDTKGLTSVTIARDENTGSIYVGYSGRTTAATATTGNVYWKMSTTSLMNSWTAESATLNTAATDIYGVDFNLSSKDRIYATWYGLTATTLFGNTVADLVPGAEVGTTSSQVASVNASSTGFYIGGAFSIKENISSRNVTSVAITQNGTTDGLNALKNVRLYSENDVTFPYDCASESYAGTELQYGATSSNFSATTFGTSTFTGSVAISTTSTMCIYPVMDVADTAVSSSTIDIGIDNASTSVAVSGGATIEVRPTSVVDITGSTTVKNDTLTQSRFHWRSDNGTEATAGSKTIGVENRALAALTPGQVARLRMEVWNAGSITSSSTRYQLEFATTSAACSLASSWTSVGKGADAWDMFDSTNLTDGNNTTDIAVATGGVTNDSTTFLTPNAAVKDTADTTAGITLSTTQFVELEYSLRASSTIAEGTTYCFRVTDAGTPLPSYARYPQATIVSDVTVSATGTEAAFRAIPSTAAYLGGTFVINEASSSSRNVTSITLSEVGTVDASSSLSNIKLQYDSDVTAPYDCVSESYAGNEAQFGATSTKFTAPNGTATYSGSVAIATTSTLCVYVISTITENANDNETMNIVINNPSTDVVVSGGGTIAPTTTVDIPATTTLRGAVFTQTHYHWRNDNGSEATATSMTNGLEDTPATGLYDATPARLRVEVSNAGGTTSPSARYRLEYGSKISTCSAIAEASWTDVQPAGGAFDMYDSPSLIEGTHTTDIAVGTGGVTNANTTFLTPNTGVKDTSSLVASTTLTNTQFIELEYDLEQTATAGYSSPYCFRVTRNGTPLHVYSVYPELTTAAQRDFKIQRGTTTISATSVNLFAGVDYVAPAASTSAFMRITNTAFTGAGNNTGGGTQNATDVTAYITNPSNILTSINIARNGSVGNTRISWELIEYIGRAGADNEIKVRSQQTVTYGATLLFATGTAAAGVLDGSKVVVFVTGQMNPDPGLTHYNVGLSTSNFATSTSQPVFQRGEAASVASAVSYAVVEFTGAYWQIQRIENTYTASGTVETQAITAVNSLAHTFVYAQKRSGTGLNTLADFGHEVWLSSVGQVSFELEPGAGTPSSQTSVAWVIENLQSNTGAMVVTRSNGSLSGGTAPLTVSLSIGATLADMGDASLFINNRAASSTTNYPRPILGAIIASTTNYELWRSDTGSPVTYRTEVVEWPVASIAFRQNYYRIYVDNQVATVTDPWPLGASDLGENTSVTANDSPPGPGEHMRLRMSVAVANATLATTSQAFKLQYGLRSTTCSAVGSSSWFDLGDTASTTALWRGYDATGTVDGTALSTNPPLAGALKLSVSDIAGTIEESNNSALNPYGVSDGSDVEYDWIVNDTSAVASSTYCFRMVQSDGSTLVGYNNYPQVRTSSFVPTTQNWRWYDDQASETPVTALAAENTIPINLANGNTVKLRVTVKETKNTAGVDARFKLQFSEYSSFSTSTDVVASSSCTNNSLWCYADGGGADNGVITTKVLSDADACASSAGRGCGTHNESSSVLTGFTQTASSAAEYEFTVQSAGPRINRTYYFRLFDLLGGTAVALNSGGGYSYPSLLTEGAALTFTTSGLATSTVTEGVTTNVAASPTTITYGSLPNGTARTAAQRFSITTNATEGYQLLMYTSTSFISNNGSSIPFINASNTAPGAWATACVATATGCYGYHAGDDTLAGGSSRFAPNDTFASFETTPREVAYSSLPVTADTNDVIVRALANTLQPAGQYSTTITYVSVPAF